MVDMQNIAHIDFHTAAVRFNIDDDISGDIFVYHNTATTSEPDRYVFSVTNNSHWGNVTVKNNIWSGMQSVLYYWLTNTYAKMNNEPFSYKLITINH